MNIVAFAIVTFTFLCLEPGVLGEAARYRMAMEEKGTPFAEEIDIDEDQDVEVFRVPAHNDVDGADFYQDFKMRLTVTRIPSRKVCYISKMDPSLPSPQKLKADLDRSNARPTPLPAVSRPHLVAVTAPANRLVLTKAIMDFCGALPIYNTEIIKGVWDNGTSTLKVERQKRQTGTAVVRNFIQCTAQSTTNVVINCPLAKWNLSCKMRSHACYYYITCTNMQPRQEQWLCSQVHLANRYPVCCDLTCP